LSDGDLRGAIRLLCSQDSLAPNDETTFLKLQEKHPKPQEKKTIKHNIIDGLSSCSSVTSNEVYNAIMSFYPGSAGGLDSLKPQHLKDLISDKLGLSSSNLLSSLAKIIDLMFLGLIPLEISQIIYGASLCALSKKDGGIRPIAVGCTLRRLAAKIVCTRISEQMGNFLNPLQLGFGTKYGAEAGAHSARNYLSYSHSSVKAFLKIDFFNAFNTISRTAVLYRASELIPAFLPYLTQCYFGPTILSYGNKIILSETGVQQGDPLGPVLFCLALHPVIKSLKSEFNVWYLDDGVLADDPSIVFNDFQKIIELSSKIGLSLNYKKCELLIISDNTTIKSNLLNDFSNIAPGISLQEFDNISLLGYPLTNSGISKSIKEKIYTFKCFSNGLKFLPSHPAYFLLKNSLSIPRMTYLLRCSPCWRSN
jgi:hypothetical protein